VSREPEVPALRAQLMRCVLGAIRSSKRLRGGWVYGCVGGEGHMKAEQYGRCGAECLRLAQLTTGDADKVLLLHMADAWRRLAERIESQSADRDERDS
jgi:hypothetical protein